MFKVSAVVGCTSKVVAVVAPSTAVNVAAVPSVDVIVISAPNSTEKVPPVKSVGSSSVSSEERIAVLPSGPLVSCVKVTVFPAATPDISIAKPLTVVAKFDMVFAGFRLST